MLARRLKRIAAQIYGIRFGLRGFYSRTAKPVELNQKHVDGIHLTGGTILVGVAPRAFGHAYGRCIA